ncbi:hypothetical protein CDS [Bradyrhizobium sp. G22]|nr:hypothetical protein CDS [Bradyrhizobium sp. G22]
MHNFRRDKKFHWDQPADRAQTIAPARAARDPLLTPATFASCRYSSARPNSASCYAGGPGHLRGALRARRDRSGSARCGLPHEPRGIVSKHRERSCRPRTCDWIKVTNRAPPAMSRRFE